MHALCSLIYTVQGVGRVRCIRIAMAYNSDAERWSFSYQIQHKSVRNDNLSFCSVLWGHQFTEYSKTFCHPAERWDSHHAWATVLQS